MKYLLVSLALLITAPAMASQALLQKNNCTACHAVDKKIVGPAFKDIAAKYANQPEAASKLSQKIKSGGAGTWGTMPMPANPQVSDADLKAMVEFILKQR